MIRSLSHTEISAAMSCWAKWDFSYGGRLAGSTLKARETAPILSDGKAWGAGVAAWHQNGGTRFSELLAAYAVEDMYELDYQKMLENNYTPSVNGFVEQRELVLNILGHYMETAKPFSNLTMLEQAIEVPIPARWNSSRASSKYRFLCFLDGFTIDDRGNEWLVEFKLRTGLQDVKQITKNRQPLWYAWARRQQLRILGEMGHKVVGVIVDERLKVAPKPARVVKGKSKDRPYVPSHAKDQITTPELYIELCESFDEEPHPDVVQSLGARIWQRRTPILYRDSELDEAGNELISSAKFIRDLDSGELYPVRNAHPGNCGKCFYKEICPNPSDHLYVDTLFSRGVPKRDRKPEDRVSTLTQERA